MYWGWWNTLVDKYSRPNTKLFVLLIINEPSLLFDTPLSRPSIAIARVLPRPKAAFLQELCFEDTVQLRPPQKNTSSLINDIDIFRCLQKIQMGSPDPGPNLRRKSSQRSLQGAGPALLLRPCWCFPHYVFFSFLLIFCIFILAIAKIQIQKEGEWILIKYIDILHQNTFVFLALRTRDF